MALAPSSEPASSGSSATISGHGPRMARTSRRSWLTVAGSPSYVFSQRTSLGAAVVAARRSSDMWVPLGDAPRFSDCEARECLGGYHRTARFLSFRLCGIRNGDVLAARQVTRPLH